MKNFRGKIIDDRYEIIDIIGVGGMANVYKAFDRIRDCYVAVKILKKEYSKNQAFVERFKNELKANASLSHPNIVRVFDVGFGDKMQYIVMEYIEGITLKDFIKNSNIINWKDVVHFVFQILRGLQHAHYKGIVHRDMKPQNIMLLEDGTVKIMDFGIARFPKDEKIDLKEAVGSVYYISPEQAMGGVTDAKSDIYSVGIMMYEMLTGKLPFEGEVPQYVARQQIEQMPYPPLDINPSLPKGLVDITLRAIKKRPQDRYQNVAEMLRDLDEFKRNPNITFNYSYFEDIENTRYFGVGENFEKVVGKPKSVNKKGKLIPILFGTAGGIFLVAMVMVIVFIFGRNGAVDEFEIPNFIGMNYEDVKTINNGKYKDLGFVVRYVANSKFSAGTIVDQSIKSGTVVKHNYGPIELKVATGEEVGVIPKIIGLPINKAKLRLLKAGFKNIKEVERYDENAASNSVVSISPLTSDEISLDTPITIYFNKEITKNDVAEIPNVIGMSFEEAKAALKAVGFEIARKKVELADKDVGKVLEQSKQGKAEIGTTVEVTINEKTNEKPEEKNEEEKTKSNKVVIEKTVILPLRSNRKVSDTFHIEVIDESNGKVVASGDYKIGDNSSIPIKIFPSQSPARYLVNVRNLNTKKTARYVNIVVTSGHGNYLLAPDYSAFFETTLNNSQNNKTSASVNSSYNSIESSNSSSVIESSSSLS